MNSTYYCGPKASSRVSSPQERRSYDIEKATVRKKKERNPRGVWVCGKGKKEMEREESSHMTVRSFPSTFRSCLSTPQPESTSQ